MKQGWRMDGWMGRCRVGGCTDICTHESDASKMDGWVGRAEVEDARWIDVRVQDHSRANKMADAECSVLDNLPLVSPLGFHFQNGQILVMLQRVGSEQFWLHFPPSVSAQDSSECI